MRTTKTRRIKRREVEVISSSSSASDPAPSDASSGIPSDRNVGRDSGDEICVDGAAPDDSSDRAVRNIRWQVGDFAECSFANLSKSQLGLPAWTTTNL